MSTTTPITDGSSLYARNCYGSDLVVPDNVARKLELDRAALIEALEGLVKANEDWNAAVAKIVTTPPTWADSYLAVSRTALAVSHANFPTP